MKHKKTVVHMTTVHHPLDPRIYYKQCKSLQNAGFRVTLLAPDAERVIEENDINVISIKKQKNKLKRMVFSTIEAYKKARKQKADYYHIHDPELLPVAWLLKKKTNVVVYDIHEDYVTSIMQKEYIPKPLRRLIAGTYSVIEKALSRRLELCLAEKYYQEKYSRGTCILNYPVLNEAVLGRTIHEGKAENKLIYTGNVSEDRGAEIHAQLPKLDKDISVHLYGKCPRPLAEEMYALAGEQSDRLYIEGIDQYVPKDEIDRNYVSHQWLAGIALFPPTEHYMKKELTKFFEYMTAGLPVICSDFPAWKEFIKTYSCGIAVNPRNDQEIKQAIDFLRSNVNEAKRMGENGRKAVLEKLNWGNEEKKLIDWYEEMYINKL